MKTLKNENTHIIKLEKGELVMENLTKYIHDSKIGFAKIEMFGAVTNVELGYMKGEGEYDWRIFNKKGYELLSSLGSASWNNEELQIHMHGSISDSNFVTYGGHIKEMTIHGVGEVFITEISQEKMFKKKDPKSGLILWDME